MSNERDEILDELIDAVSEDFTWEELFNVPYMREQLGYLMGIEEEDMLPLIFGAIQIKILREGKFPLWRTLLKTQ